MDEEVNEERLLEWIETCRDSGDERLHVLREVYCTNFEPNEEFWSSWLTDAIVTKDMTYIDLVFDRSMKHCPTKQLVSDYADAMIRFSEEDLITEDKLREAFEKCLAVIGCDIDSGYIWDQYTDFEVDELLDALEVGDEAAIQAAKARVVKLYRRQLSQPLLNHQQILLQFDSCLSENFIQSDESIIQPSSLENLCQKSQEMLAARQLYEDALESPDLEALVKTYLTYATFEVNDACPARAQRVYERGVLQCSESRELWLHFIEFAAHTLQNIDLLQTITERAVKLFSGDAEITLYRFISLSKAVTGSSDGNPSVDDVAFAFDRFVKCYHAPRNGEGEDLLSVLLSYCDIFRRRLVALLESPLSPQVGHDAVDALRNAFTLCSEHVRRCYAHKDKLYAEFVDFWCSVEDDIIADVAEALESAGDFSLSPQSGAVWENAVRLHPKSITLWSGYLKWAKSGGNDAIDAVRKLYKKCLSQVAGDDALTVDVLRQWLRYEQQVGNSSSVLLVLQRAKTQRGSVIGVEAVAKKLNAAKKSAVKRMVEDSSSSSVKRMKSSGGAATDSSSTIVAQADDEVPPRQGEHVNDINTASNISSTLLDVKDIIPTHENTVFLKNLSFNAQESDIEEAFAECGKIVRTTVLLSKAGKSRGMALVTFASPKAIGKAQHLNNKEICGRAVTVNPYHDDTLGEDSYDPKTVFVSRLSRNVTESDIKHFFESRVGPVDGIKIMTDKMSGASKGFALVQFVQEESVAAALLLNGVVPDKDDKAFLALHGKHLSVEKSKYPAIAPQTDKKPEVSAPVSTGLAAFKPRNLRVKQGELKSDRKAHLVVASTSSAANENVDSAAQILDGGGKTNADFRKYLS